MRECLLQRLTERQIDELQRRHPAIQRPRIADLAIERARGLPQILDLKRELGIAQSTTDEEAGALILLAFELFVSPCTASRGQVEGESPGAFTILISDCPVFDQLMTAGAYSLTNCPYWHRSRGWLEGLGGSYTISEVIEDGDGKPVGCSITYYLRSPSTGSGE